MARRQTQSCLCGLDQYNQIDEIHGIVQRSRRVTAPRHCIPARHRGTTKRCCNVAVPRCNAAARPCGPVQRCESKVSCDHGRLKGRPCSTTRCTPLCWPRPWKVAGYTLQGVRDAPWASQRRPAANLGEQRWAHTQNRCMQTVPRQNRSSQLEERDCIARE
jgi:hypothetical protein